MSKEDMKQARDMKEQMASLGECGPIVKKTMMKCFFVGAKQMKGAMAGGKGANELNREVTDNIGDSIGDCYGEELQKLAKCL